MSLRLSVQCDTEGCQRRIEWLIDGADPHLAGNGTALRMGAARRGWQIDSQPDNGTVRDLCPDHLS